MGFQCQCFACGHSLIPATFLRKTALFSLYWVVLYPYQKPVDCRRMALFLNCPFCCVSFHASTTLSWLLLLCSKFWSKKVSLFFFKNFIQDLSWLCKVFCISIWILCLARHFCKEASWGFDRISIDNVAQFVAHSHEQGMVTLPFRSSLISFNHALWFWVYIL